MTAATAPSLTVVLAQFNACVGDIAGNTDRIILAAREARDTHGARVVVFPELAVTGYPPEDLLFRPGLHRRVADALERIRSASREVMIVVGAPEKVEDTLYNGCFVFDGGEEVLRYHKQHLPNYAVFDEKRYFTPGTRPAVIEVDGRRLGLSVCEDLWVTGTARALRAAGAEAVINLNASPYHTEKRARRKAAMERAVAEGDGLPLLYVNQVGGQDELVFDGASFALDASGTRVAAAAQFEEALLPVTIEGPAAAPSLSGPQVDWVDGEAEIYQALVLGVRDYVGKNGFRGAVLGLSGGIDSALTAAIACDALGGENVTCILMPSRFTAQMSIDDAITQAERMGATHHTLSIEAPFEAFLDTLDPLFAGSDTGVTEENIQSRCRGTLLMALSNKTGSILLTTGNKSEMSVGYATLYGDMAGGFAPLKDISKLLVYALSRWRNLSGEVIPERVLTRPPSAELAEDQQDTDSLPPYEVLDPILELYIERDRTPREIVAEGFDAEDVNRVTRLVDRNEYKRRQAAPGVRITRRAFGRDRRFPITSRYTERYSPPADPS